MRPAEILRLVIDDYQPDMGRIAIRIAWSKEFRRYAVKAGMPGVTPRSLRHYGVSRSWLNGITEMAETNLMAGLAAAGRTSLAITNGAAAKLGGAHPSAFIVVRVMRANDYLRVAVEVDWYECAGPPINRTVSGVTTTRVE